MTTTEGTTPDQVQRTYLTLILLQTLAASLIWGVNTLFLLDAGLSITEAFVANAAFTAGMMIFEVPTGVVADAWGRRTSFILGAATLLVATLAYLALWYVEAGIWWWVLSSAFIGLGFTFFSGATEAWLVDALTATGYTGAVEEVFGKGQTAVGFATLVGTIGGGFLAQISLGVPYIARSLLLVAVIVAAWLWMHDIGYTPVRGASVREEVSGILRASVQHGWRNRPVRLFMLAAPFSTGVGIWIFYAFQPYLLELFGDPNAVFLSGIAAAIFAVAQMIGGASVNWARRRFDSRTGVMLAQIVLSGALVVGVGAAELLEIPIGFWVATSLLVIVALAGAISAPMQQAYMNDVIPSAQRATVLSFSSLMGSAGGVVIQPALGKVADVYSLGLGYAVGGVLYLLQLPFIWAARRLRLPADEVMKPVPRHGVDLA
ncbi:MAG TPA: MFS transporter [Acidimicrobiia bacterium]|nr:MFS transporter [Acidimicrobiia bacterium]